MGHLPTIRQLHISPRSLQLLRRDSCGCYGCYGCYHFSSFSHKLLLWLFKFFGAMTVQLHPNYNQGLRRGKTLASHRKSSTALGAALSCPGGTGRLKITGATCACVTFGQCWAMNCAASGSPFKASRLVALQSTPEMPWCAVAALNQSPNL